jgi:hypothetical protein
MESSLSSPQRYDKQMRNGQSDQWVSRNLVGDQVQAMHAQESPKELGQALTRDWSSETIGGFTGVYFGRFATGNWQKSSTLADFDWFEYDPGKP